MLLFSKIVFDTLTHEQCKVVHLSAKLVDAKLDVNVFPYMILNSNPFNNIAAERLF